VEFEIERADESKDSQVLDPQFLGVSPTNQASLAIASLGS